MTKLLNALMAGKDGAALALVGAPGIDIDAQTDMGLTALMIALAQEQNAVVKKLLDAGARTDLKDKHGKTALDIARDCANEEGRNMMYRRLDALGVQQELHHAARDGNLDALAFLVDEMDASLQAAGPRGKSALEEAEVSSAFEAAAFIEEKLANFPEQAGREMRQGTKKPVSAMKQIVFKNS